MARILYKFGSTMLFVIIFANLNILNAQYKYSIDIGKVNTNRIPLKTKYTQAKESKKVAKELKNKKKSDLKRSKKIRKHTYNIQTKEVRNRMRETSKKSENYNQGKTPCLVKLKNILNG